MPSTTFDPAFLSRLERLSIVARRTLRGVGRGERRGKRHGGTVEFADYRAYAAGDDTRAIDWHAYARLETLFLKLYVEEQDLTVHLLLDRSRSMMTGDKLVFAKRALAALGYVGLASGDRVTVSASSAGERGPVLPLARGRHAFARVLRCLDEAEPVGRTSLDDVARSFLARKPAQGVVVVASDWLDPKGYEQALERLRYSGHEPFALHVVAPDEEAPEPGPDVELEDAESGALLAISLDRAAIAAYLERWRAFTGGLEAFCRKHEIGYARVRTDVPFEEAALEILARRSLVR